MTLYIGSETKSGADRRNMILDGFSGTVLICQWPRTSVTACVDMTDIMCCKTPWTTSSSEPPAMFAMATVALRLLIDRREQLGVTRVQVINRIHRLLLELLPGGAKTHLSAAQAKAPDLITPLASEMAAG